MTKLRNRIARLLTILVGTIEAEKRPTFTPTWDERKQ